MESQILKFQVIPSMPVEIDSQKMTKGPSPTQAGKLRLRDKLSGGEGGGQRERERKEKCPIPDLSLLGTFRSVYEYDFRISIQLRV